ncbi:hypothetical protein D3C72_2500830 [compost metagenome]
MGGAGDQHDDENGAETEDQHAPDDPSPEAVGAPDRRQVLAKHEGEDDEDDR